MIDPKTLTIGSHVEYNGKRMIVVCISDSVNGANISLIEPTEKTVYKDVLACNLEPIHITAELLTEYGFGKEVLNTLPRPTTMYVDAEYARLKSEGIVLVLPMIKIQYINVTNPFWYVSAYGENVEDNKMAVRYLHELEQFLYIVTKTELIKE